MTETDTSKTLPEKDKTVDKSKDAKKPTGNSATSGKSKNNNSRNKLVYVFLLLLIILAVVLGGALYYQQTQYQALQDQLKSVSNDNIDTIKEAQKKANQALALAESQNEKLISLNNALESTNNQLQEIDRALQMVSDSGSDLLLLNDIDHLVTIAQQQLSLGGNVANAIVSLEAAQAQLARANRSAFVSLQQSINGDLDKLRAVVTVNLPALSDKVDELVKLIGRAPLIVPDTADTAVSASGNSTKDQQDSNSDKSVFNNDNPLNSKEYWSELSKGLWQNSKDFTISFSHDLRELFDIRKVSDEAALLMSPDQARRFRETLSQRALTAQLALLMGQTKIWLDELEKIASAVDKRFDMHSEDSRKALNLARELHDTSIEIKLPKLENSLSAIAAVRDDLSAQDLDNKLEDTEAN